MLNNKNQEAFLLDNIEQASQLKSSYLIKYMEQRLDHLSSKTDEYFKTLGLKAERASYRLKAVEEHQANIATELMQKNSQLLTRLNDRVQLEQKIRELLEKQQQVVRAAESRVLNLQRTLEEQQMRLTKAEILIEELKREFLKARMVKTV